MAKFKKTVTVDGKEQTVNRTVTNALLIEKMEAPTSGWERTDKPKEDNTEEGKGVK